MKKIVLLFGIFLLVFGFNQVQAVQADPIKTMESITTSVQNEIKKNRARIEKDPKAIYEVVNQVILPHVDFVEMAIWMAGKSAWSKASAADQAAFIKEFKVLVVRTYATSLNKYNNEIIEFFPMQTSASSTRIQISSKIHRLNKEDLRVDYRLISNNSTWKLYDVIIEGVSILKGFQAQFSEHIRNNGLKAVTQEIKLHNEGKS